MNDVDQTLVSVECELIDLPAQPAYRWREGLPAREPARTGAILRLGTADGLEGVAVTERGHIVKDLVERRLRAELLGQDASRREWIWHRLWELDRIEEFPIYTIGLVDVALWDLAGKVAGLPVHRLLGGFRDSLPAYASTVTYGSSDEYLDIADQCLERGFHAIKLHAWGDARRDAALATRLREHVGDGLALMYDGSAAFDLADAVYLGRALGDAGYLWYEEPMREFSVTAYRWLAERVDVPLLLSETSDGAHWNMGDYIASGCATHVRTSAEFKGGVTGAVRIAHLAEAYGLRAEVHGGGEVSRHLCLAIPNTTYYEALVWGNPIVTDESVGRDGLIRAADGPGFADPGLVW